MGKIINLGGSGVLDYTNKIIKSPIILDIPEISNSDVTIYYPKKYVSIDSIDYLKIKEDGFNTVLMIDKIGEFNHISVETNTDNSFKIIIKKHESKGKV